MKIMRKYMKILVANLKKHEKRRRDARNLKNLEKRRRDDRRRFKS